MTNACPHCQSTITPLKVFLYNLRAVHYCQECNRAFALTRRQRLGLVVHPSFMALFFVAASLSYTWQGKDVSALICVGILATAIFALFIRFQVAANAHFVSQNDHSTSTLPPDSRQTAVPSSARIAISLRAIIFARWIATVSGYTFIVGGVIGFVLLLIDGVLSPVPLLTGIAGLAIVRWAHWLRQFERS